METKIENIKKYNLTLTADEARWLATLLQNPFEENESQYSREMREVFFNSVKDALAK